LEVEVGVAEFGGAGLVGFEEADAAFFVADCYEGVG
jgi:hypothetical protein